MAYSYENNVQKKNVLVHGGFESLEIVSGWTEATTNHGHKQKVKNCCHVLYTYIFYNNYYFDQIQNSITK